MKFLIIGFGLLILGFIIDHFRNHKKGEAYEALGRMIYDAMLVENPAMTEDEIRLYVYEVLSLKEMKKVSLEQLADIHRKIQYYLALGHKEIEQEQMRDIVESIIHNPM